MKNMHSIVRVYRVKNGCSIKWRALIGLHETNQQFPINCENFTLQIPDMYT